MMAMMNDDHKNDGNGDQKEGKGDFKTLNHPLKCGTSDLKNLEPSFNIDVAHLVPAEEGIILQNHLKKKHLQMQSIQHQENLICVPHNHSKLPRCRLAGGDVHLQPGSEIVSI